MLLLKNYARHGYHNVVIGGGASKELLGELKDFKTVVFTLYVTDDAVLKQRVLTETRDSGFRDHKTSIENNKKYGAVFDFPNEHKIDSTNQTPEETVNQIVAILTQ